MLTLKNFLLVGFGGGLGAGLRFFISTQWKTAAFPYATLLINIGGSLLIGMIFALSIKHENFSTGLQLFLMIGFCGGFTTFSAFSLENVQLLREGHAATAALYISISIMACVGACFFGYKFFNQ